MCVCVCVCLCVCACSLSLGRLGKPLWLAECRFIHRTVLGFAAE
jgi:hypothetical protein